MNKYLLAGRIITAIPVLFLAFDSILYAVPRTSLIGALLLTAFLGGAVATHARIGDPMLTHSLFPVYVAVLLWTGLWLRDARLRALAGA